MIHTTFSKWLLVIAIVLVVPSLAFASNIPPSCFGSFADITLDLYKGEFKDDVLCSDFDLNNVSVVSANFDSSIISLSTQNPSNDIVVFNFTAVNFGQTQANITVTDGIDNVSFLINFTVIGNSAPDCSFGTFEDTTLNIYETNEKSDNLCVDFEGDTLSVVNAQYDSSIVSVALDNSTNGILTVNITGVNQGSTLVNITVSDGQETSTFTLNITVIENVLPDCSFGTFTDTILNLYGINEKSDNLCVDFEGNTLSVVDAQYDSNIILVALDNSTNGILTFNFTGLSIGSTTAYFTISDGQTNTTFAINFTVVQNVAPDCTFGTFEHTTLYIGNGLPNEKSDNLCLDFDGNTVSTYSLEFNSSIISIATNEPSQGVLEFNITPVKKGNTSLTVVVTDGLESSSFAINFTVMDLRPQIVGNISDNETYVNQEFVVKNISQYFTDKNDNILNYSFIAKTISNGTVTFMLNESTRDLTILADRVGMYYIYIYANDETNSINQEFILTVPNRAPEFNESKNAVRIDQTFTFNLSSISFDPDGQHITYTIVNNSNNSTATCDIMNETLTCNPLQLGSILLLLNATDGFETISKNFSLAITPVPTTTSGSGGGSRRGNIGPIRIIETPVEEETEEVETETETDSSEENTESSSNSNTEVTVPQTEATPDTQNLLTGEATGPNNSNVENLLAIGGILLLIIVIAGIIITVMRNKK